MSISTGCRKPCRRAHIGEDTLKRSLFNLVGLDCFVHRSIHFVCSVGIGEWSCSYFDRSVSAIVDGVGYVGVSTVST